MSGPTDASTVTEETKQEVVATDQESAVAVAVCVVAPPVITDSAPAPVMYHVASAPLMHQTPFTPAPTLGTIPGLRTELKTIGHVPVTVSAEEFVRCAGKGPVVSTPLKVIASPEEKASFAGTNGTQEPSKQKKLSAKKSTKRCC
ncbi:MAG: hypothetical protein ACKPKO_22920, partial [Candidatus Fonsibacter sp.]